MSPRGVWLGFAEGTPIYGSAAIRAGHENAREAGGCVRAHDAREKAPPELDGAGRSFVLYAYGAPVDILAFDIA